MADSSFDIVSKIDRQEVDNALGQTAREIATRFDFKGTGATIEWQGDQAIEITANADDRAIGGPRRLQGEAGQAPAVAEDPRRRRAAPVRPAEQDRHRPQGGHHLRGRQEDRQADPRRGPQGRQGADPGRRAARLLQEARRPPGRAGPGQAAGLRLRGAVHQLPPCWSRSGPTRALPQGIDRRSMGASNHRAGATERQTIRGPPMAVRANRCAP